MFDFLNQYKIIGNCTLEDFYSKPSSALYQFLLPLKKESFADNERIVFYNFSKINIDLLIHLQKTLTYLDIPEFFVLVVTNQKSTIEALSKIECKLVSYTEFPAADKIIPIFNNDDSMCAHAWVGIHLFPDGTAKPCCDSALTISKPDGIPYNIKQDTIDDILNSECMQEFRQAFRNKEKPISCNKCWQREDQGQESRRTITPYKIENIYGKINWEQEGELMYLGGHLGTLCNLKCRICSSNFSSSIANEYLSSISFTDKKDSPHYQNLKSSEWVFENTFWDYLKFNADKIKNYEFLGGEPFMLKQNLEFLKFLVDRGFSKDTIFYFTTNGTQYPNILDYSEYFKRLEITFSVDNVGERFELERCNAIWSNVEYNLNRMIAQREKTKNLSIDLCITVNIQNVLYLPEIFQWVRTVNVDSFYINYVLYPKYLSITNLTTQAQDLVIDRLTSTEFTVKEKSEVTAIIEVIKNSFGADGTEFIKEMKRFDQIRNQDFAKTHTDIAKAMGYE
jgi:MoaA/NifB/PqqE/SkfB family radical SAM enzyme